MYTVSVLLCFYGRIWSVYVYWLFKFKQKTLHVISDKAVTCLACDTQKQMTLCFITLTGQSCT